MQIIKEKTAGFDVDVQKGFTPLCPDELPVAEGDTLAEVLNQQATLARLRIGSKDAHPGNAVWPATEEKPQFSEIDGRNVDIRWNAHCIVGTRGHELINGLPHPADYDFFVQKGMEPDMHPYGACHHDLSEHQSTGVIEFLRCNNIETILVGGLATDYCVKTTALQLRGAGFNVIVNLSACRGIAPDTIRSAIDEMKGQGIIIVVQSPLIL